MALKDFLKDLGKQGVNQTMMNPTTNYNKTNNQVSVSKTIPASSLNTQIKPVPNFGSSPVPKNVMATVPVFNANKDVQEIKKQPSLSDSVRERLATQMAGGSNIDLSQQRADLKLEEKRKRSVDLENAILQKQQQIQKQIEETEKNRSGMLTSGLNGELNQLSRESSRELADLSIAYKIANDDYQGAEATLKAYEQDLKDSRDYELNVLKMSMDYLQDDLTESEKMQIEQQFRLDEIDYENKIKNLGTGFSAQKATGLADSIQNGIIGLDKISNDDLPAVLNELNTRGYIDPTVSNAVLSSKEQLLTIDGLLKDGTGLAVGAGAKRLLGGALGFFGGADQTQKAKTDIDNIISNIALTVLPALKGPASDKDIQFIKEASSKLAVSQDPADFNRNLKELRGKVSNALVNSIAVPRDEKRTILKEQFIIEDPTATPEQINEMVSRRLQSVPGYQQSFSSAGNASASTMAQAIKKVESGGDYYASGASGEFGAYQFMPATWKQWAGEYLGDPNAQPTPQNQDFVAQSKISSLISQGKTPEQIALIWNGGTPVRKAGVNKYGVKYDSGAYADKVINTLRTIA